MICSSVKRFFMELSLPSKGRELTMELATRIVSGQDYLCLVELVPDGSRVKAESGLEIASGTSVELRVWVNPLSNTTTYKVVH